MEMTCATWGRIFIKCDKEYKNNHTFNDGETINLGRQFNNFDRKYTQPVNAIVIDSTFIPEGAEVLLHHNSTHPTYELPDYKGLDGEYLSGNERYFSIPESECYAWRIGNGGWNPAPGFEFGLRIFKPYEGALSGILPKQIKNKLLIISGEYCGKVAITKANCDYEMIFQTHEGREGRLIRIRHFKEPSNIREEIIGICNKTTELFNNGEYMAGLSPSDAKQINVLV